MKIMHVIDSAGIYGAENMLLSLMRQQVKAGHDPVLASIGAASDGEKAIELAARKLSLNVKTFRMHPGLNIRGAGALISFAREEGVNILHTHGYKGSILLGLMNKKKRKLPLVSTVHGWTNTKKISKLSLYELLDQYLLPYKDAVVLVSPSMLSDHRIIKAEIDSSKLSVIENGVDLVDEHEENAQQDEHIGNKIQSFCKDDYIIGAIGRLSKEKGYDYLLKATRGLLDKGHQVKLVLLGEGNCRSDLQKQIQELDLNEYVLLVGYVENAKDYLSFFDVFAISSLTEGFPITLLEAMNAKVPVVSTSVGCIPEVLKMPDSGLLVSAKDSVALTEALIRLKDDPVLAKTLVESAYEKARTRYSSQTMAEKYQSVYERIGLSAITC